MQTMSTQADIVGRLVGLLSEVTEERLGTVDPYGPDSVRRLGLDSVTTLSFLVAVEDAFGIEWDDDLPDDVLASFEAMARHLVGALQVGD